MGLDTSHDCWHSGYVSFGLWRNLVARAAGIPLELMEGFCRWTLDEEDVKSEALERLGWTPSACAVRDIARACVGVTPIKWTSLAPDALHHLLNHSDCDGEIASEHCAAIAERLEQVLPLLPDKFPNGEPHWAKERTQQFINGLRLAASRGENVEFN